MTNGAVNETGPGSGELEDGEGTPRAENRRKEPDPRPHFQLRATTSARSTTRWL
jgi:hypothetical protein